MIALFFAAALGSTNPAVTQANIYATICVKGWTKTIRPPAAYTNRLKHLAMRSGDKARDFEEDHIIPLELGGAPMDERNLQLQPRFGLYTAEMKDHLENYEHRRVCSGKITLRQGQAAFRGDWTKAYEAMGSGR